VTTQAEVGFNFSVTAISGVILSDSIAVFRLSATETGLYYPIKNPGTSPREQNFSVWIRIQLRKIEFVGNSGRSVYNCF